MSEAAATTSSKLAQVIQSGVEEPRHEAGSHPLWTRMREIGTELWLDTGDMDQAAALWSAEFTALTTNNTLLNKEIQKGLYDDWIPQAAAAAREDQPGLGDQDLVLEVAFALNARHGLRLVQRFGAYVSVELHTDLAHDVERSVAYGKRYHALCPDRFIVKVPLTPSGLIAARQLSDAGIPVNFTLGFSARQNYLIASVAQPAWVNVFMGRLNAYVADEGLGDGNWVGERATVASQAAVAERRQSLGTRTAQIGASMRVGEQVATLAGLDVYTMPCGVAEGFLASKPAPEQLANQMQADYQPTWADGVDPEREGLNDLWQLGEGLKTACAELARQDLAQTAPDTVVATLNQHGQGSLFPALDEAGHERIRAEGKLPKRASWQEAIANGSAGLDALLTLAGLYAFAKDQSDLDERIRRHLG